VLFWELKGDIVRGGAIDEAITRAHSNSPFGGAAKRVGRDDHYFAAGMEKFPFRMSIVAMILCSESVCAGSTSTTVIG
jgi:hypothetical protein